MSVQETMDRLSPRIRVEETVPPRPAQPSSPLGVSVSIRVSSAATHKTVHVVNMEIHRFIEVDRDSEVRIIADPKSPYRGASNLSIKSAGRVRIISFVPGKHKVAIAGTHECIEFDGVDGSNFEIENGMIIGMFRARLLQAQDGR